MSRQGLRRLQGVKRLWRHILILSVLAWVFFPLLWVISASVDPRGVLVGQSLLPPRASLEHYRELFTNPRHPFGLWFLNSVKVAGLTALLSMLLCALGAYAFSRFRFRGRRTGLLTLLLIQIFPQFLAMVAIYLFLKQLGEWIPTLGLNTHAGLILVYLGGAIGFNTWLMKGFFDTVPRSLDEAALIDGATPWQVFWRIILPLSRPVLAVIFILVFIGTYSDFILASILLKDINKYTFAVGLKFFIENQYNTRWGPFAAASILGSLPIVMIFLAAQRWIVSGLTRGAVKG